VNTLEQFQMNEALQVVRYVRMRARGLVFGAQRTVHVVRRFARSAKYQEGFVSEKLSSVYTHSPPYTFTSQPSSCQGLIHLVFCFFW